MAATEGHFPGETIQQGAISVIQGERIAHWEVSGAIYHVSLHLADSVPADQLNAWREARAQFAARRAARPDLTMTDDEVAELRRIYDERVERYLSAGHGCCALRAPETAEAVARAFEHGHSETHELHVLTIMPNHLHVIASPLEGHAMKDIVDGWKSVSAHIIAKRTGMSAPIWQRDHYSRIIRTPDEYRRQDSYVWHNPDSAGLQAGYWRKRY